MRYNNYTFTKEKRANYYDNGLRAYMLSIYQNMAIALGISAIFSYIVVTNLEIGMILFSYPIVRLIITIAPVLYILFF